MCDKIVFKHALKPNSDSVFGPNGSWLSWHWGRKQLIELQSGI